MARKTMRRRVRNGVLLVIVVGASVFFGFTSFADNQPDVDKEATRLAGQFAKQLSESLKQSKEFEEAFAGSPGCATEIAGLIVAQAALLQAQHDYDEAYQALEECLNEQPEDPPPPEPTSGEFSVLVK